MSDMQAFDDLAAEFAQSAQVARSAARAILRGHAQTIADDIRRDAPSAEIRDSIIVTGDASKMTPGVDIIPTHPLSHLFEFGAGLPPHPSPRRWRNWSQKSTGIMPPEPFVWQHVDKALPGIMRDFARMRLL